MEHQTFKPSDHFIKEPLKVNFNLCLNTNLHTKLDITIDILHTTVHNTNMQLGKEYQKANTNTAYVNTYVRMYNL